MLTDNHEFDKVYEQYKNLVLKTAYIYSGDYSAAEDITQETFLQLYIYFSSLKPEKIKAWLCITAKNRALNYRKKVDRISLRDESEAGSECRETSAGADEIFIKRQKSQDALGLHERILAALYEKNERWYQAFLLVYYLEISQAKAAEEMEIRVEVLHSILHRTKRWIKKTFGVEYDEWKRF